MQAAKTLKRSLCGRILILAQTLEPKKFKTKSKAVLFSGHVIFYTPQIKNAFNVTRVNAFIEECMGGITVKNIQEKKELVLVIDVALREHAIYSRKHKKGDKASPKQFANKVV